MRPKREVATNNGQTYFVTSNVAGRRSLLCTERWSKLFVDTLLSYRPERYLLHAFVVMPDHFHVLLTPAQTLERAVQCIKGGFSYRAKRELGWHGEIWVPGFSDHRLRDESDCDVHLRYIAQNPVKERMVESAELYPYSSACGSYVVDAFPQGLKPPFLHALDGAAEAAPFQSQR